MRRIARNEPNRGARAAAESPRRALVLVAVGAGLLITGCQPGLHWRLGRFADAHAEGRRQEKLTFVYFRAFLSTECTRFEDQVLAQQPVREATADMVCVPLEFSFDRPLAESWGLEAVPAFAIVDPQGRVLASGSVDITQEALLEAIRRAKEQFALETQPVSQP